MPPERSIPSDIAILPLTFVQVYASISHVIDRLMESDATFRSWFGASRLWRMTARWTVTPLYYHWATAGYGAFAQDLLNGWLFIRGWRQMLYIEALVTRQNQQRKGIASALMNFAEQQAHELRREWLGLTVTVDNAPAVQLYEKLGYKRAHWRLMRRDHAAPVSEPVTNGVALRPVMGLAAERAYRTYTRRDLAAGDSWASAMLSRLVAFEPHRQLGHQWVVVVNGQAVGYLNRHGPPSTPKLFLAADPAWWGKPQLLAAVEMALHATSGPPQATSLRLASTGHHDAAGATLAKMGFKESAATTARMLKYLGR